MGAEYIRDCAFDVAALVKAAIRTPRDKPSAARKSLIAEVALHLEHIAGTTDILWEWQPPNTPLAAQTIPAACHTWDQVIGDVMSQNEVVEALLLYYAEASGSPGVHRALALAEGSLPAWPWCVKTRRT